MYVYAIQANQYVKIGKANNPRDRMNDLQVGNPVKLKMLFKILCQSEKAAEQTEAVLHKLLNRYAANGEWFQYGPIAYIIRGLPQCKSLDEMCSLIRQHFKHQRRKRIA